ncbi:diguanylate cyclase [Sphingomonas sp. NBWT7]|nr:diguanylate cyclase [Sphingomonas sp. NBWT7]
MLSEPSGALAQRVARLTDGGVRITGQDIAALGGTPVAGAPVASRPPRLAIVAPPTPPAASTDTDPARAASDALLARTEAQVAGFSDTVRSIHAETSGFGRDLAASAAAMRGHDPLTGIDQIAELTTAMIGRVRDAEQRLANAEREADVLRDALDEARGSARRDPLTDLANRRAFDEAFAALAPDTPVAIAVCDIDHFKRVNDDFGHAVGDRVLRAIGQTLAAETEGTLVARYGGEEFAMLIVGGDRDAAITLVDAARSAVAARRFRSRETDTPIGSVTISGGIAVGTAADSREQLYAAADAALYRAKAAGRNRIVCAA